MNLGTEGIWVPELEPRSSRLLQAAIDDRFFRIWAFEKDGAYPKHRDIKDEIELHVTAVVDRNGQERLVGWAQTQPPLMRGYSLRGPEPYDPERHGERVAALYRLELHISATLQELAARAAYDPSRTDRTYATVPGLYDALDKRFLLPIRPENVDPRWSSDPLVLYGAHALYAHPLVRDSRELLADVMALVSYAGLEVRLAVDPHAVTPRDERPHVGLFDYWYGVVVDKATLDDPHRVGHTRHERRADRHESMAMPLLALDID